MFENFKLQLQKDDNSGDIEEHLTAANGTKFPSELIWIEVFKHIQHKLVERWIQNRKIAGGGEIQWIISVPPMWSDKAKSKMKQWAIRAGLVKRNLPNQCHIVYESDCAVLGMLSSAHIWDNIQFKEDEKFILIDAGGGTVDFSCQKLLDKFEDVTDYKTEEILPASGGPWGSCYIDAQFEKLLNQIFTSQWMIDFKQKNPHVYVELLRNFQEAKKLFYFKEEKETEDDRKKQPYCSLPGDFIDFMSEKIGQSEDIEEYVSSKKVVGQQQLSIHNSSCFRNKCFSKKYIVLSHWIPKNYIFPSKFGNVCLIMSLQK